MKSTNLLPLRVPIILFAKNLFHCRVLLTLPLTISISMSAFLAHLSQKFGSSREMSVRFPDATKLAWKQRIKDLSGQVSGKGSNFLKRHLNDKVKRSPSWVLFTLAKVDPRPSDSIVMVFVLRCRIWSISSSQNLAPSSSSSMMAP